jgi:hypothetical protein
MKHVQSTFKRTLIALTVVASLLPTTQALAGALGETGQIVQFTARKNDGLPGPVAVPDDGFYKRGAPLRFKDMNNGTIKDIITGLIWEKKCDSATCATTDLHHIDRAFGWNGDGATDTIWDWLDDLNAEGGTGFAGRDDWRMPNIKELQTLVNYGAHDPSIDGIFGPTPVESYWSATTHPTTPSHAWVVNFSLGEQTTFGKLNTFRVRAVRGGRP